MSSTPNAADRVRLRESAATRVRRVAARLGKGGVEKIALKLGVTSESVQAWIAGRTLPAGTKARLILQKFREVA